MPPFEQEDVRYRDRLCVRQMQDFNDALCSYYARHCVHPPRCPARSLAALKKLLPSQQGESCHDSDQNCLSWARSGECERNTGESRPPTHPSRGHAAASAKHRRVAPRGGERPPTHPARPHPTPPHPPSPPARPSPAGFMTANCRQSCGKCDHVVLLGTPANCADAAECGGAREAGRCEADAVALLQARVRGTASPDTTRC